MVNEDSRATQDVPNTEEEHQDAEAGEVPEEYKWLQEQLAEAMRVGGALEGGEEDDDADGLQDASGILYAMLHHSEQGSAGLLKDLIEQLPADVSIDTRGPDGDTCLHIACLYGHQEVVELLLAKGADAGAVNTEDGSTPLHDAAASGWLEIVRLLLARVGEGALAAVDEDGDTVLHHAARGDHLDIVKLLVEKGASAKARNRDDNTPREESDDPAVQEFLRALE